MTLLQRIARAEAARLPRPIVCDSCGRVKRDADAAHECFTLSPFTRRAIAATLPGKVLR